MQETPPEFRFWTCPKCAMRFRLKPGVFVPVQCERCAASSAEVAKVFDAPSPSEAVSPTRKNLTPIPTSAVIARRPTHQARPRSAIARTAIVLQTGWKTHRATITGLGVSAVVMVIAMMLAVPLLRPRPEQLIPTDAMIERAMPELIKPFVKARLTAKFDTPPTVRRFDRDDPVATTWRVEGTFDSQNTFGTFLQHSYTAVVKLDQRLLRPTLETLAFDGESVYRSPEFERAVNRVVHKMEQDLKRRRNINGWREVLRLEGKSNKNSHVFSIDEDDARLRWEAKGRNAHLRVDLYSEEGKHVKELVDVDAPGSQTVTFDAPDDRYQIRVHSYGAAWTLIVEE